MKEQVFVPKTPNIFAIMTGPPSTIVHWLKLQSSDWRANLAEDLFLQINFPPMRALEFIAGHVIFKLHYDQIYQMKTTLDS